MKDCCFGKPRYYLLLEFIQKYIFIRTTQKAVFSLFNNTLEFHFAHTFNFFSLIIYFTAF
jgi:hypothetical protein